MQPRGYQADCLESICAGFRQYNRQLIVLPTGAGKTLIIAWLAQHMTPGRTLVMAHRDELIDQAIDKIRQATGIYAQKEKAEFRASPTALIVVASVQTMARRLHKWPIDHFALVVADEAHHAVSDSWQTVLRHFSAKQLGVTATPDRADKKKLGSYFENIPFEITLFELIHQGFLAPIRVKALPVEIDLAGVSSTAGDFDAGQLREALTPYLRRIAQALKEHASFRKALVFLPLRVTSRAFTEVCREEGLSAAHVDGDSPDRKEIIHRFGKGEFDVLNNAMLLTEGYDDASIDCVVVLRPTRSRALYSQMVGRGTRIHPAKEDLLILDFLWLHEKHNLIRPSDLVATTPEISQSISEGLAAAARSGKQEEFDLEELAGKALHQREEKLRDELKRMERRKAKTIDAMEFCLSLHNVQAADYEPTVAWEAESVSEKQASALSKWRIDPGTVKCRGHASAILDMLFARSKLKLATPGQLEYLRRFGHPSPETATAKEASAFLDKRFNKQPQRKAA